MGSPMGYLYHLLVTGIMLFNYENKATTLFCEIHNPAELV